ncbi:O-antigen ligase [Methylosinus sp. PW1]|uniref:O-antigen ligase family protein n=1 Tax=Methylosinus sp. PW1 TaxID=107636 RepID=UPI00068A10A5|nr:O-antigen ligase family protein [Methylosinus sp. PW1]
MDPLNPGAAPQTPFPILLALTCVFTAMLVLLVRRSGSLPGCFVVVAVWLRVISGAYHFITFLPLAGGFSINALLSVLTVGAGVLVVNPRNFVQMWMVPIYVLLAVTAASAILNGSTSGAVDMFFKWGYAAVLIAAMCEAMRRTSPNRVLMLVAFCYAPIFVLQVISVVFGIAKDTEGDGAVSYIGGYNHEAAFSIMIVTFVLAVYFNTGWSFVVKAALISMGVLGIFLANYRTAIVAILPLLLGTFMFDGVWRFDRKSRSFIFVMAIPLVMGLAALAGDRLADRFGDLATLLTDSGRFLKPPQQFLEDEQKILSGRLYIWSNYVTGYLHGTDMQLLLGDGPNSWVGTFVKYAHNTMVSYLYELGVLGLMSLLALWATFVVATFRVPHAYARNKLLLAQACFLLFNLATMPHWNIEGNILFALLQASLLYHLAPPRRAVESEAATPGADGRRFFRGANLSSLSTMR